MAIKQKSVKNRLLCCVFVCGRGLHDEKGVLGFTRALCSVLRCCCFCVAKLHRGIYQLKTCLIHFSDNNEKTMDILPLLLFSSTSSACQHRAFFECLVGSKVHLIYGSRQIFFVCVQDVVWFSCKALCSWFISSCGLGFKKKLRLF